MSATPPTITPPGTEITAKLDDELKEALRQKMEGAGLFESEDDRPHHHAEGKPSIITAAASGLVNFLLMFGMCCAYGIIMFSDDHNRVHVPLAIKMNLSAALVIGLLVSFFSKVPVAIGGPDINPAVFLGLFVEAMAPAIADDLGLDYPEDSKRRLGSMLFEERQLAGISSSDFCMGAHLAANQEACGKYHDELTATTIFATAFSTMLLGVVFLLLGSLKLTRYMAFLPTTIVEAFLACVGYKVFEYAVKQCEYDPLQFVPAGIIGIGLYFMKAKHIGNPAIVMPLGFLLPLLLFHLGIITVGSTVNEAREKDWMFAEIENVDFWEIWTQSIGKPDNVNIQAWTKTLPDLAIMLIVVCLDCVLKVVATDTKLPVHVDPDYEVRMHGVNNLINTWSGSAVAYMQLKFNVINYGIVRNVVDRRASIIYALLCGICYFGTLEPFNVLPRFFIGSLLFFAGSGFVAENLWGSRGTTSIWEWGEILVIVLAFILTGQLVIAVLIGGLITFVIFIAKYAKISVVDGPPLQGGECRIVERMGPLMTRNIRYLLDNWLLVVKLKGYVFFASANTLTSHVGDYIEEQQERNVPAYRRLKYVVFDCSLLDGMDASAAKAMKRLVAKAVRASVRVLWTHLTPALASELRMRGLLTTSSKDVFTDVDEVVMQVESAAKTYMQGVEAKWVSLHPAFERFAGMTRAQFRFEPFTQILLSPMYRIGCPWRYCSTIQLHGHSTLLFSPGDNNGYLYLVHSGAVALFRELPEPGEEWDSPVAVYRQGWFLNRETLMRAPSRYYGVAIEDGEILCWSPEQWWRMACEMPLMTSEILKTVMKQQARDSDSFDEHAHSTMAFSDSAMRDMVYDEIGRRQDSGNVSRGASGPPPVPPLPEEIQVRLIAIETAQCLEKLGFYTEGTETTTTPTSGEEPKEDKEKSVLPELPAKLKADIATAFKTYSRKSGSIAAGDIPSALMYAGLFHCPEVYEPTKMPTEPMTEDEFVQVCHRALMAPFTSKQMQVVRNLFGMPDQNGETQVALTLTAAGLQRALRKAVPGITPEMADAFFVAWRGSDLSIPLDIQAFTGIMSLLVRLHEPYFDLMQGCRAVIGADRVCVQLELHYLRLVQVKELYGGPEISAEEAEELLWSADWRMGGNGDGKVLGWPEMVSAITATLRRNAGALPATCLDPTGDELEIASLSSGPSAVELSKGVGQSRSRFANVGGTENQPGPGGAVELKLNMKPPRESIKMKAKKVAETWWTEKLKEFNGKTCLTRGAIICLVFASILALVLEPVISGEDHEQTNSEEQVWLIVEICITVWLALEFIGRIVVVGWTGLKGSGHTQITLLLDLLATIPLALDGVAELLEDGAEDSRIQEMAHDGIKDAAALFRVLRLARIHIFSASTTLAAPVATMMVVVWGIYVKHGFTESK